jgi:hypothetical protein
MIGSRGFGDWPGVARWEKTPAALDVNTSDKNQQGHGKGQAYLE